MPCDTCTSCNMPIGSVSELVKYTILPAAKKKFQATPNPADKVSEFMMKFFDSMDIKCSKCRMLIMRGHVDRKEYELFSSDCSEYYRDGPSTRVEVDRDVVSTTEPVIHI